MTLREYLNQAFYIDGLIRSNRLEVERLRALISFTPGSDLTKPLVRTQAQKRYLENTALKIAALEAVIQAEIDDLLELKKRIRRIINAVDNAKLRLILHKRYIELKKWHEIANEMNYGIRRITQLHGQAIAIAEEAVKKHCLLFPYEPMI